MRHRIAGMAAASLALVGALAACSHDEPGTSCFGPVVNGVVLYMPGIDALVRDANGHGRALGTTMTVYRGTDSAKTTGTDTLHIRGGFLDAGNFKVRVSRPFYQDAVLPSVAVLPGQCNVVATVVPVTLQVAAGAPPIRSIAVLGVDFLYAPGVQRQLSAQLDADAGIPATVIWRLSDTTLARIDGTGLVTAKCSLAGGVDTVTAMPAADTTFKGKAIFGVAKMTTCP